MNLVQANGANSGYAYHATRVHVTHRLTRPQRRSAAPWLQLDSQRERQKILTTSKLLVTSVREGMLGYLVLRCFSISNS